MLGTLLCDAAEVVERKAARRVGTHVQSLHAEIDGVRTRLQGCCQAFPTAHGRHDFINVLHSSFTPFSLSRGEDNTKKAHGKTYARKMRTHACTYYQLTPVSAKNYLAIVQGGVHHYHPPESNPPCPCCRPSMSRTRKILTAPKYKIEQNNAHFAALSTLFSFSRTTSYKVKH